MFAFSLFLFSRGLATSCDCTTVSSRSDKYCQDGEKTTKRRNRKHCTECFTESCCAAAGGGHATGRRPWGANTCTFTGLPGLQQVDGELTIEGTQATSVNFPDLQAVQGGSIVTRDNGILAEVDFQNLAEIVVDGQAPAVNPQVFQNLGVPPGELTVRQAPSFTLTLPTGSDSAPAPAPATPTPADALPGLQQVEGQLTIEGTQATSVDFPDLQAVQGGSIDTRDDGILAEVDFQNLAEIVVDGQVPAGTQNNAGRRLEAKILAKQDPTLLRLLTAHTRLEGRDD